jgi:hypothetical protein
MHQLFSSLTKTALGEGAHHNREPNQAQEAGGRKAKAEVYDERLSKRGLFSFTPISAT